jgi:hypothetical protein
MTQLSMREAVAGINVVGLGRHFGDVTFLMSGVTIDAPEGGGPFTAGPPYLKC